MSLAAVLQRSAVLGIRKKTMKFFERKTVGVVRTLSEKRIPQKDKKKYSSIKILRLRWYKDNKTGESRRTMEIEEKVMEALARDIRESRRQLKEINNILK